MRVIAGIAKGRKLKFPKLSKERSIRPLTEQAREALFNILAGVVEGCRFLDLFAGTGAVGIEALSRGASVAFFVDVSKKAVGVIRENLETTGLSDRAEVYSLDVLRAIKLFTSKKAGFDIVFIGAPYDSPILEETLRTLSSGMVIDKHSIIIAEHRYSHKLSDKYGDLIAFKDYRYGDTELSMYKLGACE